MTPSAALLWSGFIATTLASGTFWFCRAQGLTALVPSTHLGCYLFRDPYRPQTDLVGILLILALGSTVLAALYLALLGLVGEPRWTAGAVVGAVHGVAAAAALPLLARANRCIRQGTVVAPGPFGVGWGRGTPVAIVLAHAVYGGVLGAVFLGLSDPGTAIPAGP